MAQAENQKIRWSSRVAIGASEVIYLAGLLLLLAGLWLWFGPGQGLTACGAVLILTAILNGWIRAVNHVV